MVPIGPKIMITTSNRPSDNSNIFAKLLQHVIPNSQVIRRGRKSLQDLWNSAVSQNFQYIYLIYTKQNKVSNLEINEVTKDGLITERVQLEIKEYIDHKIFGFSRLPGKSPMSTTREVRAENPQLIDFFIKYFHVSINTKNSIWMMLDKSDESYCYIQFVDALSLRKIFFAKVKIMQKGKKT